jgi:hypothetical protein
MGRGLLLVGGRTRVSGGRDWTLAGLLEVGAALVFGIAVLFFAVLGGAFGGSGGASSVQTVAFGTGGSDCDLSTVARTFAPGDAIRAAAGFSPNLPTGSVVKISLSRDGTVLESSRETLTLDEPAGCVSGRVSDAPLAAGHYRWDISADTSRGISGEFDVTSRGSRCPPSPPPSSKEGVASMATRES